MLKLLSLLWCCSAVFQQKDLDLFAQNDELKPMPINSQRSPNMVEKIEHTALTYGNAFVEKLITTIYVLSGSDSTSPYLIYSLFIIILLQVSVS